MKCPSSSTLEDSPRDGQSFKVVALCIRFERNFRVIALAIFRPLLSREPILALFAAAFSASISRLSAPTQLRSRKCNGCSSADFPVIDST